MPQQRRQQWQQQQQNDMRALTPVRSFMASADDAWRALFLVCPNCTAECIKVSGAGLRHEPDDHGCPLLRHCPTLRGQRRCGVWGRGNEERAVTRNADVRQQRRSRRRLARSIQHNEQHHGQVGSSSAAANRHRHRGDRRVLASLYQASALAGRTLAGVEVVCAKAEVSPKRFATVAIRKRGKHGRLRLASFTVAHVEPIETGPFLRKLPQSQPADANHACF